MILEAGVISPLPFEAHPLPMNELAMRLAIGFCENREKLTDREAETIEILLKLSCTFSVRCHSSNDPRDASNSLQAQLRKPARKGDAPPRRGWSVLRRIFHGRRAGKGSDQTRDAAAI